MDDGNRQESFRTKKRFDTKGDRLEFESMQQGEDDSVVIMDNDGLGPLP